MGDWANGGDLLNPAKMREKERDRDLFPCLARSTSETRP